MKLSDPAFARPREIRLTPGQERTATSSSRLRQAIVRTRSWLLAEQKDDGHWVAELEGDTILESETILLLAYLGRADSAEAGRLAQYLIDQQLEAGGWSLYPGGPAEVSASVKAYFALKLTGHAPSAEYMQRARAAILAAGGADRVNSFTRFYLALLGQIPYDCCPEVPPEAVLLPKWTPVNMYHISAWSRTIFVPLSIISAFRPVRAVEPALGIRELFCNRPEDWPPLVCPGQESKTGPLSWDRFFRVVDNSWRWLRKKNLLPLRQRAIAAARDWMLERFQSSDGLGAIFPPMVWSIVALECLDFDDDSPEMLYCHRQLRDLFLDQEDATRVQPCKSPVWDTAITLRALAASGVPREHRAVRKAVDWLLKQQIRSGGDWSALVKAEPGGWCFEHNNAHYPDSDDTAMALIALRHQFDQAEPAEGLPPQLYLLGTGRCGLLPDAHRLVVTLDEVKRAADVAIEWTLAMQNRDGGWGAFDRDNDHEFLCHVPFADHNAMIDPSTPDLAARVLEGLAAWGLRLGHPAVDRAVAYLRETQEADGSWYGRWGVNYVYGTWQTVVGLVAVGVPTEDPAVVAAANWLLAYQQPDGGWGESPASYEDPSLRGQGPVTASQTAWALLGLMAAGRVEDPAVARGIRYLIDTQLDDGTWYEQEFTGTGFPRVFYLRYHMYPIYFPLMALSRWAAEHPDPDAELDPPAIRSAPEPGLPRIAG